MTGRPNNAGMRVRPTAEQVARYANAPNRLPAQRECLGPLHGLGKGFMFKSAHAGERICPTCRKSLSGG